ncbi:DNA repair protein RecN [Nakamurella lactea]|uniref:DNA repair protein RecN n=1 Tax=Nakamurella lactea TaxID=459515 RepID=UPI000426B893|nr:DNA repair protein RecN [Nakamurella lactea]
MLSELRISGLGVISDAVIEPHPGLTVVTGETGAGKTMVVTALGLAGGGRGDAARVRAGAEKAAVEARWHVPAGTPTGDTLAAAVGAAGGALDDDGSVICVRTVSAEGRSRAHIGGRTAPLAALAELTEPLLAVHGQSEAISLLQPAAQRQVLDRYAGLADLVAGYRDARAGWQAAAAELADRTGRARELAQREQLLRMGLAEIDQVAPLPGEDAELNATVRRLENVDALRSAAAASLEALSGSDVTSDAANAVGLVGAAEHLLAGSDDPRLTNWAPALHQAMSVLTEVGAELSSYLDELDDDPAALEQTLSRQAVLRALSRRYGADTDAVLAWAADARRELASLDSSDEALAALAERVTELGARTAKLAVELSRRRTEAAGRLGEAATAELAHLAMGRAKVRVAVSHRLVADGTADDGGRAAETLVIGRGEKTERVHAGPDGIDQVEIVMTAHRGAPELPIAKGASGGELSRVMLALEVVLAGADTVGTLVFDEVDAGVGGRAATEIGRRLAMLARSHQVIVVTHLAQVAAFADRHVVVDAGQDGSVGTSSVTVVDGRHRLAELARMLGGTDTDTALAHAKDLLAAAG